MSKLQKTFLLVIGVVLSCAIFFFALEIAAFGLPAQAQRPEKNHPPFDFRAACEQKLRGLMVQTAPDRAIRRLEARVSEDGKYCMTVGQWTNDPGPDGLVILYGVRAGNGVSEGRRESGLFADNMYRWEWRHDYYMPNLPNLKEVAR